jgi:hypothetical protein
MNTWTRVLAVAALAAAAAPAAAAELRPFVASYSAKYTWLSVGEIRLELRRGQAPDTWVWETQGDPGGIARLITSATLVQTSRLELHEGRVRPLEFELNDGVASKQEDISLDFDWTRGRVTGSAKGKPVDVELVPDTQDPVSFNLALMTAMQDGRPPGPLPMVDGPKLKTYQQKRVRNERIKTPAGTFDTVLIVSSREGSDREAHMWLAPELGYLAVQVEQYRKGKRLFAMYLERYRPGT